jgi:2,3-dihydroxybenzoate decarboxylase
MEKYASDVMSAPIFADVLRRLVDTESLRMESMDKAGIALSILSFYSPGIQSETDLAVAVQVARRANDFLCEQVVARHPDRYAGFAAVPLQDPEAAANELERCVKQLGFKGAMVNGYTNVRDENTAAYTDEPKFEVFWAKAAELGVPIYLHPRDPLPNQQRIYEGHPELLSAAWAFGVETATHALRLITSGLFDRYPGLNVILGHLGETLPFAIWRVQHMINRRGMCKNLEKNVSRYLADNFFITTSGNFRTQALLNTMLEVSSDRILFSTDYPYESAEEAASWFDSCPISQRDRVKIGRENAAKLFGLRTAGGSQPNLRDDETSEPSRTPGGRRGRIPDRVRNNHRPS